MTRARGIGIGSFVLTLTVVALLAGDAAHAQGRERPLAPGVLTKIPPDLDNEDTYARHDIVELVAVDSNFDWAKQRVFRRDVWGLTFEFKPIRFVWIDVPGLDGNMERKLVWYMVYKVTNGGGALHPVEQPDGTYTVETTDLPVRFVPEFLLVADEVSEVLPGQDETIRKAYADEILPLALGPIQRRERVSGTLHTSVTISEEPIPVGESRWGVAMWDNVDPRIDRFSVYVAGLTNAYRWTDEEGAYQEGDAVGSGRRMVRKVLKLNFWRPGDEYEQKEKEIRFGVPDGVDYEWLFR